tara:strand:+ start:330 stop:890 length:561 start_codon:yes stop_codon:yes gene_type:complete
MTVYVDMDMVLVQYYEHFQCFAKMLDERIDLEKIPEVPISMSTVGFIKPFVGELDALQLKRDIYHSFSFWKTMPFKENAEEVFKWLYEHFDVYIATSAFVAESEECIIGKYRWIEEKLPYFDKGKLIYCQYKSNLKGGYIIDDVNWLLKDFGGAVITFDYPYNRHIDTEYRVKDWLEIKEFFEERL